MNELWDKYKTVDNPELEVRVFDGFGGMDVSQSNFAVLKDVFSAADSTEPEWSLTYQYDRLREVLPLKKMKNGSFKVKNAPSAEVKKRIKDITIAEKGVRVSLSTETPQDSTSDPTSTQIKQFRLRERLSVPYQNWRVDFTRVYQHILTVPETIGHVINVLRENAIPAEDWQYEVEIELVDHSINNLSEIIEKVQGIKKSPLNKVYAILEAKHTTPRDLMNQVITMGIDEVHTIADNYSVTEKADGVRMLILIDDDKTVYKIPTTGIRSLENVRFTNESEGLTLLDTEYLEALDRYLIFDILIHAGQSCVKLPFTERYALLTNYGEQFEGADFQIKHFLFEGEDFGTGIKLKSVFSAAKHIYKQKYDYELDGLIFTPMHDSYYNRRTYKWKPTDQQTLDLLIMDPPKGGLVIGPAGIFKVVELYFLINFPMWLKHYKDNRELNALVAERFGLNMRRLPRFFPYPFAPPEADKPVYRAKIKVQEIDLASFNDDLRKYSTKTEVDKLYIADGPDPPMIPIMDGMVVEFSFIDSQWKPYRFRKEKTEEYLAGLATGEFRPGPNGFTAAMSTWSLIQHPVSEGVIFGDESLPEKYYKKTKNSSSNSAANQTVAMYMYKYNNHVKRELYNTYIKQGDRVLEIAGGRGGDLDKLVSRKVAYLMFTDIDEQALIEARRRMTSLRPNFPVNFLQLDWNNDVSAALQKGSMNKESMNVVSCQFALHYFFGSLTAVKQIAKQIDAVLAPGGIFMFTGLDGRSVFELLKKSADKQLIYEKDGTVLASIKQLYTDRTLKGYGQQIEVFVEKIGIAHPENLLNFEYICDYFVKKLGYTLIETQLFADGITGYKDVDKLSSAEREYAGINRFAVLRKFD